MKYYFEEMAKKRNSPLNDDHPALYRGYTDEQCDELNPTTASLKDDLGIALGLKYSWERTENDKRALRDCCAHLRALSAAQLRTGKASHFSFNRDGYLPLDSPCHSGDPRDTYARTRYPMERLAAFGFIVLIKGEKDIGKESIAWLTDKGWEWVNRLSDPTAFGQRKPRRPVSIMLRDKKKKPIDFPWTDEARRMEANLAVINNARKKQRIFRADGSLLPYEPYTRIFNRKTDLSDGGRFYLRGRDNHQNMDHEQRRALTWEIDGVRESTDEFDCSCLHAKLAYRAVGLPAPSGDLYAVDGDYPRRLCKIGFQTMVNARNNPAANGSIANELLVNEDLREGTPLSVTTGPHRRLVGDGYYDRKVCKQYVWGLMRAIKAKHRPIKRMFCSGAGLRFQRLESDWAERVMLTMIELIDLCPLYVYDSFRVPARYKNLLRAVMKREALAVLGMDLELKEDSHAQHIGAFPSPDPDPNSGGAMAFSSSTSPISASSPFRLEDSLSTCMYMGASLRNRTNDETDSGSSIALQTHSLPVSLIRRTDQDRGPPYG